MRTDQAHYGYTGNLSQEFVDFARRQHVNHSLYKGVNHRQEQRNPMMLPVLMVAIDDDDQPIGVGFDAITRDVNSTTIGLLHSEAIYHQRFAIHMSLAGMEVDLAITLLWSGPMGPFYGSAGRYVKKLTRFPGDRGFPTQANNTTSGFQRKQPTSANLSVSDIFAYPAKQI